MSINTSTNLHSHLSQKHHSSNSSNLTQKSLLNLLNTKCNTSLQYLKQAHALIIRTGHFQENYTAGSLIKYYSNPHFDSFHLALKVFDQIPNPNVFSSNFTIRGCLQNNEPRKAVSFYYKMLVFSSRPNKFTYPILFKACTDARAYKEGVQIHAHVVKHGFGKDGHIKSAGMQMYASFVRVIEARAMLDEGEESSDVVCWNALLYGYLRCGALIAARKLFEEMNEKNVDTWNVMISGSAENGLIEDARRYFNEMPLRDDISWSAMIDGYIKEGCYNESLGIFDEMQKMEIRPSKFILSSVLAACANVGALDQGRWIHAYVKKNSIQLDAVLGTALVDMYAKCGRVDIACEVFEQTKQKQVFTWNAMINGFAMHGRAHNALELFSRMDNKPNEITFMAVLNACSHAKLVDEGLELFYSMKKMYGIEPAVEHYGCVVDLLGRAGLLEKAEDVIRSMPMKPNAAIWGALLGACRIHGNLELGERVGKLLIEIEPENSGRYAMLSDIYEKAGKWDKAADVRKLMKEKKIKTITGVSMIDVNGIIHEFKIADSGNLHEEI